MRIFCYLFIFFIAYIIFQGGAYAVTIESSDYSVQELSAKDVEKEFSEEKVPEGQINIIKLTVSDEFIPEDKPMLRKAWNAVKGKPVDDAVNFTMFTFHTRNDRDNLNESNKLIGVDLCGISAGTFVNSFYRKTYYAGLSRKVYEVKLPMNSKLDFKYRFVLMHGYKPKEFHIGGITPIIVPVVGFTKGHLGIDFFISPGHTITFATNMRFNLKK